MKVNGIIINIIFTQQNKNKQGVTTKPKCDGQSKQWPDYNITAPKTELSKFVKCH